MARYYVVRVPLEPPDRWFDLCRCVSPEAAAAVLQALLSTGMGTPVQIRVDVEGYDEQIPR